MTLCSDLTAEAERRRLGPDGGYWRWRGRFCLGIDLGRHIDPTSAVLVQRVDWSWATSPRAEKWKSASTEYLVRAVRTLPLSVGYEEQLNILDRMLSSSALAENGGVTAVVDEGGAGLPQVERLRKTIGPGRLVGVTLTAGREARRSRGMSWTVPKSELVQTFDAALASGELKLSAGLREMDELMGEIRSFQIQSTPSGSATFNAAWGAHDDRVIATMLAVWWLANHAVGGGGLVELRGI